MTGLVILLVIVVLAIVAVGVIMSAKRKRRSEGLQDRFGPEYDRAVDEHGDRKAAESHLADVADRRDNLEITELSPGQQSAYTARWMDVQASFVDEPSTALHDADRLVGEVMRTRGYPVDDFDTKADMVAADHPDIADHYRRAHAVGSGPASQDTEEQRQAFVHYRALFDELLGSGTAASAQSGDRDVDLTEREERAEATTRRPTDTTR
jgi:hypothetical protein